MGVKQKQKKRREKLTWVLTLLGISIAFAAWGYAINSPFVASVLYGVGLIFLVTAVWALFELRRMVGISILILSGTGFLVGDIAWIRSMTRPSFFFVKPGALLNPGTPNAFWVFIVTQRGADTIFNARVAWNDQDRQTAFRQNPNRLDLLREQSGIFKYDELDPSHSGATSAEDAQFYWKPLVPDHEHFEVVLEHRGGVLRETLRIELVGMKWQYAMRVQDEARRKKLIECKDSEFPKSAEFPALLPACFPNY